MISARTLSDSDLIHRFIQDSLQGKEVLLANGTLQAQRMFNKNQLISKTEGVLLTADLDRPHPSFWAKADSSHVPLIIQTLATHQFLITSEVDNRGFHAYQYCNVPAQYQLNCTSTTLLWRNWWKYHRKIHQSMIPMQLLIRHRGTWYPIKDISCVHGFIYIQTLGSRLDFTINELVVWLNQRSIKLPESVHTEAQPQRLSGSRPNFQPDFRSTAWKVER